MHLAPIDVAFIAIYGAFVLVIGLLLRRQVTGSTEFFLAGRSMPAWVAGLAFLSANLGAQEMIGMAASGAKYGILTSQPVKVIEVEREVVDRFAVSTNHSSQRELTQ